MLPYDSQLAFETIEGDTTSRDSNRASSGLYDRGVESHGKSRWHCKCDTLCVIVPSDDLAIVRGKQGICGSRQCIDGTGGYAESAV